MKKAQHQTLAGIIVLAAWFLALAVGLINHDYQGLQLVTPVMIIYAGYVFGESYFARRKMNGTNEN